MWFDFMVTDAITSILVRQVQKWPQGCDSLNKVITYRFRLYVNHDYGQDRVTTAAVSPRHQKTYPAFHYGVFT